MIQLIQDIKPTEIISAYTIAPFDKGKAELEKNNYQIISLEENARLRIQKGADADISQNGNWTREGVLYLPDKRILLTKNSPIIDFPDQATNCHRNGKDFYLEREQIEKSLKDSIKIKDTKIPTNRFNQNDLMVYALGDTAEAYGDFLSNLGINELKIWLTETQDKPFIRQLWFYYLPNRSDFCGYNWDLDYNYRVRGVLKDSAKPTRSRNELGTTKLPYTSKQVDEMLQSTRGVKQGKLGTSNLEQVIGFLETLRQ
jgi:hypothetical protein